jgi:repressor LexA
MNRAELRSQGNNTRTYILEYIKKYISKNKYSPTFREIAVGTGLKSIYTVHRHLNDLQKQGVINYNRMQPRTIELKEGA